MSLINGTTEYEGTPEAYCFYCGADWSDWYKLDDDQKERVLEKNPDAEIGNLDEGCCPSCGCSFLEEDDEY